MPGSFSYAFAALTTARTVAAAIAHRLHGLAHGPALRPSSFKYGVVFWDLEFVLQHVRATRELLSHPQADSGPDWFPAISPVVAHAFDSIRTILGNLDMQAADRNLYWESFRYCGILEDVEAISNGRCGSTVITSAFVGSLVNTFSRLIGEDDWKNTRSAEWWVQKCRDVLLRLEAKFPSMPTGLAPPDASPASGPSKAGPSHRDQVSYIYFPTLGLMLICALGESRENRDEIRHEGEAQLNAVSQADMQSGEDPST